MVVNVAFSPDGSRFAVSARNTVATVWDLAGFRPVLAIADHDTWLSDVTFSPDGRWLVTAEDKNNLHVRRAADGTRAYSIHLPPTALEAQVAYGDGGRTLIVGSTDGVVRRYHAASGVLLDAFDVVAGAVTHPPKPLPGGRQLLLYVPDRPVELWRIDGAGARPLERDPAARDAGIGLAQIIAGGSAIFAGDQAGNVSIWDARTGDLRRSFRVPGFAVLTFANDDGSRAIVADVRGGYRRTTLWNVATGSRVMELDLPHFRSGATSPDGRTIALATLAGPVIVLDATTGERLATWELDRSRRPPSPSIRAAASSRSVTATVCSTVSSSPPCACCRCSRRTPAGSMTVPTTRTAPSWRRPAAKIAPCGCGTPRADACSTPSTPPICSPPGASAPTGSSWRS
jgi:WD40 repeat protein